MRHWRGLIPASETMTLALNWWKHVMNFTQGFLIVLGMSQIQFWKYQELKSPLKAGFQNKLYLLKYERHPVHSEIYKTRAFCVDSFVCLSVCLSSPPDLHHDFYSFPRMKRPPLIRTTEEVKIKLDLLEACYKKIILLKLFI